MCARRTDCPLSCATQAVCMQDAAAKSFQLLAGSLNSLGLSQKIVDSGSGVDFIIGAVLGSLGFLAAVSNGGVEGVKGAEVGYRTGRFLKCRLGGHLRDETVASAGIESKFVGGTFR